MYCFMEKETQTEKETVKRTAEVTKTSERTVRRIVKEGRILKPYCLQDTRKKEEQNKVDHRDRLF